MTIEISQKDRDTKSWLQQAIADLEHERDLIPGVLNEDAAMALHVMKLAMAAIGPEQKVNNHPAHGPVSINRLYQIREILSRAVAQSDGGHLGYAMADALKVINGVLESVAREQVELPRIITPCEGSNMLERKNQNEQLTHALATLSTNITFSSKQSMLDTNRVMETILPTLLNQLYHYALVDLNIITHNHPAIDLGDDFKRLAVQITSDGSKSKMVSTLDKFKEHGLDNDYDTIWFLIISNAQKCSFSRQGYNIEIKNLADIARDICQLPQAQFEPIYAFCKKQFRTYFQENSISVLAPVVVPSNDPARTITNFLTANDLVDLSTWQTNATHADIRNDLIALKEQLSELNDDQRWFIFQVMKWSMANQNMPEYCMVPLSVIESGKDSAARKIVRTTVESLESIRMAYYVEESRELNCHAFSVHFVKKEHIEEFDYFAAIATFLNKTEQTHLLERIVVQCDFSVIN